jgi:hypothetical protein
MTRCDCDNLMGIASHRNAAICIAPLRIAGVPLPRCVPRVATHSCASHRWHRFAFRRYASHRTAAPCCASPAPHRHDAAPLRPAPPRRLRGAPHHHARLRYAPPRRSSLGRRISALRRYAALRVTARRRATQAPPRFTSHRHAAQRRLRITTFRHAALRRATPALQLHPFAVEQAARGLWRIRP